MTAVARRSSPSGFEVTGVDADHAIRVIRARCSDALAPSDLALIEAALTGDDAIAEVLERVVDVVDAIATRLDALEEAA